MFRRIPKTALLAALLTSMMACGGGGGAETGTDTSGGNDLSGTDLWWTDTDGYVPNGRTISQVQQGTDSVGCSTDGIKNVDSDVQYANVVVVSPKFVASTDKATGAPKLDGYYLMDYGLGTAAAYSGIMATVDSADNTNFQVGDVLSIKAEHIEYYCMSELSLESFVVVGSVTVAEPLTINPQDLGTQTPGTAEPLEGVLVQILDVTVTNANPDGTKDYGHFQVTGDVIVGNDFGLAYMNKDTSGRTVGDQFAKIVGVVKYDYGQYLLMPRSMDDLVEKGVTPGDTVTDTDVPITDTVQGDDQIKALQEAAKSVDCTSEAMEDPNPVAVELNNVVVVAPKVSVSANIEGYYVSELDVTTDFEYRGVFVAVLKSMATDFAPGDVLHITGTAIEYYCQTQIVAYGTGAVIEKTGVDAVPGPFDVDPALFVGGGSKVSTDANYTEPLEGVVVTIRDVVITADTSDHGWFVVGYDDGRADHDGIEISKDYNPSFTPVVGQHLASITGPVKYSWGKYRIMARVIETEGTPVEPTPDMVEPTPDVVDDTVAADVVVEVVGTTTINAIQSAALSTGCVPPESGQRTDVGPTGVRIQDVVITSGVRAMSGDTIFGYYGSDYPSSATTYNGIFLMFPAPDPAFDVGDRVFVTSGDVSEYSCMSQITVNSFMNSGSGVTVTPVSDPAVKTALAAGGGAAAEPYEGMLVSIADVSKVTEDDPWLTVTGGIKVRNDYGLTKPTATNFASITGLVRYIVSGSTNQYKTYYLAPRTDADIVAATR